MRFEIGDMRYSESQQPDKLLRRGAAANTHALWAVISLSLTRPVSFQLYKLKFSVAGMHRTKASPWGEAVSEAD